MGRLSGLAMPNLSLDIPGGGGKVGVVADFELSAPAGEREYRGWMESKAYTERPLRRKDSSQ